MDSTDFWEEAEECLERFDFANAARIFRGALKIHPNNPEILDALGDALLQMGDVRQAQQILMISLKLAPNQGSSKFLNLGQLSEGKQAIEYYTKGIELLNFDKKSATNSDAVEQINEKVISALCAIAEIYMTDECTSPEAELECGNFLSQALAISPNNFEALQLMASFKISQQNNEEALNYLKRSKEAWINVDAEERPPFDFRLQSAKLHIELEDYDSAAEILEMLLEEFDENAEVWYLLGFVETFSDPESALENLKKAKELLVKANCTEQEILHQVDSQIQKATEKVAKLPPSSTSSTSSTSKNAEHNDDSEEDGNGDGGMDTTQ